MGHAKLFDEDTEMAWRPNARDIATVVKAIRDLGELGALPAAQVTAEALPEEVRLNRERQVWLMSDTDQHRPAASELHDTPPMLRSRRATDLRQRLRLNAQN